MLIRASRKIGTYIFIHFRPQRMQGGFMKRINYHLTIVLAVLCAVAHAQEISMQNAKISGGFTSWDNKQNRLIRFDNVNDPNLPAAQQFSASGESSAPVFALKDIPGAQWLSVWDAAALPGGNVALSGVAGYAKKGAGGSTKPLILIYDNAGQLKGLWNVYPYHLHKLVANTSGELFALGDRLDETAGDYPMLTKYSPDGHILWQSLSTSLLRNKEKEGAMQGSNLFGESQILVHNDEVFVWLPRAEELFHFSAQGELLNRAPMKFAFRKFSTRVGFSGARLDHLAFMSDGTLLAQFTLWPNADQPITKAAFALAQVAQDGSSVRLIGPTTRTRVPGALLGVTADDKLVFQELNADNKAVSFRTHGLADLAQPANVP
jgi:hypothetical protein